MDEPHELRAAARTLPEPQDLRVGFIGAGRLARALSLALQVAGVPVVRVASRSQASARALADALPDCRVGTLQAVARDCDLVFLTSPDALIAEIACAVPWRMGQSVVHCSGATPVAALQPAAAAGAWIGGFHPLQAFGADPRAALASLPGCTVAIEAEPPLDDLLHALTRRLGCVGLTLPPGARARYHASGGYASQHIHVLLAEAVRLWQSWGATEQQALDALLPLLRGTLESLAHSGVAAGMPGPVSRGDAGTVRLHRQALQAVDPDMRDLYDRLCRRGVDLARQAGRLDAAGAVGVEQVLDASPEPGAP
ncbi:MAG: DUF2520 domain-containing protein [Castellaniella sp.]|uniref:Rossmann-like and DUF2520 domain-containing protein n=1 Tax=Castellaniella sp. TaxID=1955812 RepID=UPI002A35CE03|nr:DUF2520 domain-containing protein [Castellaniella sp.]MDY0308399.1 DUF2520 domain-containing protein [Castellaniella sp.]